MILICNIKAIKSKYLSPKNSGLGNVLFQISSIYGIAKKYGYKPDYNIIDIYVKKLHTFGDNKYDKTIFRNILELCEKNDDKFININEEKNSFASLDKNLIKNIIANKTNAKSNIMIDGYLQSHLYFNEYREDMLNLFKIDEISMDFIRRTYPDLFNDKQVPISLHIRFNWNNDIKIDLSYYKETILFFKNMTKDPIFYLFTDDIDKLKKIVSEFNINYVIVNHIDYIDLWIMSLCHHNIVSFSTLSWWGAYLNTNKDKKILYPRDSLRVCYGIQKSEIYLERLTEHYFTDWISIASKSIQ